MNRTLTGFVAFGALAALTLLAAQGATKPANAIAVVFVVAIVGAALGALTRRRP